MGPLRRSRDFRASPADSPQPQASGAAGGPSSAAGGPSAAQGFDPDQGETMSLSDKKKIKIFEDLVRKGMKVAGYANPEYRVEKGETTCMVCKREFDTTKNLKSHVQKVHQGQGKFLCQEGDCEKRFQTRQALRDHEKSKHGDKGEKCEEKDCQKVFGSKRALKLHMKLHGPVEIFKCPFCDTPFKAKRYMKEHRGSCHLNPNRLTVSCPICQRTFHQRKTLNKHMHDEH